MTFLNESGPSPGILAAAALLPPLGLYLDGGIGSRFWTGVALTLAFFLPGVVFALITVTRRHAS